MQRIGLFPLVGDLLHAGHIWALQEAKTQCDYLIVCLNCIPDDKQPVESIYERYTRLKCNKYVDEIIPYQGEADLEKIIVSTNYHIRFLGEDYKDKIHTGYAYEIDKGVTCYYISRKHDLSSTKLKDRINTLKL